MEKGRVRVNFNEELNGIELFFYYKLDEQTIKDIKEQGFRWSSNRKRWYTIRTPEREQFVNEYFNGLKKEEKTVEAGKEVATGVSTKTDIVERAKESSEEISAKDKKIKRMYLQTILILLEVLEFIKMQICLLLILEMSSMQVILKRKM